MGWDRAKCMYSHAIHKIDFRWPCCMLHAVCLMSLMKNDSASSSRANSHPQEIAV